MAAIRYSKRGDARQPYAAARGYMPDSHTLRQEGVCPTAIRCGRRVYVRQPYAAAKGCMPGCHTLRQRGVCPAAIRCSKGVFPSVAPLLMLSELLLLTCTALGFQPYVPAIGVYARQPFAAAKGVCPSAIRCGKKVCTAAIRCGKKVYAWQPCAAAKRVHGSHTLQQKGVCLAAIHCGKRVCTAAN